MKTKNINFILALLFTILMLFFVRGVVILGNANSLNANTTYENNFTHLNVSNSSIKLYMPFDENYNSTYTFDYTANSNDGTLKLGTIINTTGCIYGNCYTFDGVDDYIDTGSVSSYSFIQNTGIFTLSQWVKFNNYTDVSQYIAGSTSTGVEKGFYFGTETS
ncbi:MAG: hypothetical protein AABY22_29620, partial [Nanoarchaeota archaeon]